MNSVIHRRLNFQVSVTTDPQSHKMWWHVLRSAVKLSRGQLTCDGTRTETTFRLSAKWTTPFKSDAGRQFSRLLASRGVRISGSNAGYTIFRGSVKSTGYPLHSPVSPPVRHRVPSHFNWTLHIICCVRPLSSKTWHHHHHQVPEGLGVFLVPWSSKWSWSYLHIIMQELAIRCYWSLTGLVLGLILAHHTDLFSSFRSHPIEYLR